MANLSEAAKAHKRECNQRYNRERYYWLKENGFCVTCGSRYVVPGQVRCAECKRKDDEYKAGRYDIWYSGFRQHIQRRKEAGLCTTCGAPAAEGKQRCENCLAKHRDYQRVYKLRKRFEREAQAARERSRP